MPTVSSGTVGRNCSSLSPDPLLMEEWCHFLCKVGDRKMVLPVLLSFWYRSPRTAMHFQHTVLIRRCAWVSMWCGGGFGNCLAVGYQAVTIYIASHVGN